MSNKQFYANPPHSLDLYRFLTVRAFVSPDVGNNSITEPAVKALGIKKKQT